MDDPALFDRQHFARPDIHHSVIHKRATLMLAGLLWLCGGLAFIAEGMHLTGLFSSFSLAKLLCSW